MHQQVYQLQINWSELIIAFKLAFRRQKPKYIARQVFSVGIPQTKLIIKKNLTSGGRKTIVGTKEQTAENTIDFFLNCIKKASALSLCHQQKFSWLFYYKQYTWSLQSLGFLLEPLTILVKEMCLSNNKLRAKQITILFF